VLLVLGYRWREQSKANDLKQSIASRYQGNAVPVRERIEEFRERIEGWIAEVRDDEPETWANPRLNLAGLHRAQGVYLRIHESQMESPEDVERAAQRMAPDAITRCLGLAPVSLRGFYSKLEFFDEAWLEEVIASEDVLRLRVLEETLNNRLEQDVPLIMDTIHSSYFLLVVQHGENRREHPVDAYLWDLRRGELLLKTRVQSRGTLMNVRIGLTGDVVGGAPASAPERSGATDCSIASQIRAAAGDGLAEVENTQPPPEPAADGEGEADDATPSANEDGETDHDEEAADQEDQGVR